MESISVKQARQKFARLVDRAQRGASVMITRRGKRVAKLTPVAEPPSEGMPDLTQFRASLGKPKRRGATIKELRNDQRY
jgi:prevent-host-death family protein